MVHRRTDFLRKYLPMLSVVVPVKDSDKIRELVEALIAQDYDGEYEIIIVGDEMDETWRYIEDYLHLGYIRCFEVRSNYRGRDANLKRDYGLRQARGAALALTDSDMVPDPDWISKGVAALLEGSTGVHDYNRFGFIKVVAGGMYSAENTFSTRYSDTNELGGKTPRVSSTYTVTAENYGDRGRKPPIMANVFFTREVLDLVPLDIGTPRWDDYIWFWAVVSAGYDIQYRDDLAAGHYHRSGLRALFKEYMNSGTGCLDFIRLYPKAPFAKRRWRQVLAITGLITAGTVATVIGSPFVPLAGLGLIGLLGVYEAIKARRIEAFTYPYITAILGFAFYLGVLRRLSRGRGGTPASQYRPNLFVDGHEIYEAEFSERALWLGPVSHAKRRQLRRLWKTQARHRRQ